MSLPLSRIADGLLAVLLAPACAACDAPLSHPSRGPVCGACWDAIGRFTPPLCDHCGDPLPSWRVPSVAAAGASSARGAAGAHRRSPEAAPSAPYDGSLRAIVHAFKYDGGPSLARGLGRRVLRASAADLLARADIVVPVPLHRSRQPDAGLQPGAELARQLGVPVVEALSRSARHHRRPTCLRRARHANVAERVCARARKAVDGLRIVLVDDVSTTGATLEACARVLRAAGAARSAR